MTKTTTVASKAFVAIVAAAMVFTLIAPAAKAATTEELQAQITALMAQIAALNTGAVIGTGNAAVTDAYTFTRSLTIGATGADVTALQNYVISKGHTIPAGATGYFGTQTQSAVAAWQSANGVMPPAGYFGPISQAKYMALMAAVVVPTTPTTPGTTTPGESAELGGNANLENFEMDDADDTEVQEGQSEVEVGVATIEFTNGDAEISILDIRLTSGDAAAKPWDAFETISLSIDGDIVAEADASDEDDYLNEDRGTLRFTNLDLVVMEDEEVEIMVLASMQNNLDTAELSTWTITPDSLRFFDADGVAVTERGSALEGNSVFIIEEAGQGEELNFSLASSNPDSTDVVVDETSTTNDVTILAYNIEAEEGDIELNRLVVRVETPGDTTTDVINDIEIEIDGQTFRDEAIRALVGGEAAAASLALGNSEIVAGGMAVWYLFDIDGDITIDEDEEVEVKVNVDFKRQLTNYSNGQTIRASVNTTERGQTRAEGADDLIAADFSGSAVGDSHTLVATGIVVSGGSFKDSFTSQGQNNTIGIFKMDFEVTAVEGDFYIADVATLGTGAVTGIEFTVEGPAAPTTATGVLSSTGDENTAGTAFVIREGKTETITLTVTVDAASAGQHRIVLGNLNFTVDQDGVTLPAAYTPTPVADFRTAFGNITNI